MIKRNLLIFITITAAITLTLAGCGKNNSTSEDSKSTESSIAKEESKDDSKETIASEASGSDDASLPDYLTDSFTPDMSGDDNSTVGDATNAVAGQILSLTDNATKQETGATLEVPAGTNAYSLKIDSIKLTDDRNEYETGEAKKVVRVEYEITNNSSDEDILVDAYSFRLMNSATYSAYSPYALKTEDNQGSLITTAAPGATVKCAIGFAVNDDASEVTLIFDDVAALSGTEYYFKADL